MTEQQQRVLWVKAWKHAGEALERRRVLDVRTVETRRAVESLAACFDLATSPLPARPHSGLVEQDRWFHKLRS